MHSCRPDPTRPDEP